MVAEIKTILTKQPGLCNSDIIRELRRKGLDVTKKEANRTLADHFQHERQGDYKHWSVRSGHLPNRG